MTYLLNPDKTEVFNCLKKGQTLSFFRQDPRHGLIDVRIYITDEAEIVVSPLAKRHSSELQPQFYRLDNWDTIWQEWDLEAPLKADDYTLM
ncbi:hypothetical protein K9N68_30575 [Kovacikia minuta CCNUW1]|uniref:hypothetical protein n=1 Tax=Kovacikia minuta TaxID=2931930 RepID=UPI001CCEF1EF|nr:hypothetical protein [Kovacikia minuta]UBF25841.1 hypothetical protein K9N68_30575 [Kovacikia minuta CCNUW1]